MALLRPADDKAAKAVSRFVSPLGAAMKAFVPAPVRRRPNRFDALSPVLGRLGQLEVRLARSREEVKAAQHLRYKVFYGEMAAQPSKLQKVTQRDSDGFDRYCDHLLVFDASRDGALVGTYRLMRQSGAELAGGFYTQQEFDVEAMIARHPGKRFLELGRSCVMREYRGKRTVELLWQGIWAYVLKHRVDVMFGCASLAGTDPVALQAPLSFLRDHAAAPLEWQVRAQPHRGVAFAAGGAPDPRRALAALPPLLKGYLRLGGFVGEGAVVDYQFGTTDVLIVLPVERINPRYIGYYGADAGRFAA